MITRIKFYLMMRMLDTRAEKGFPMVVQERCPGGQVKVTLGWSVVRDEVWPSLLRCHLNDTHPSAEARVIPW